MEKVALIGTIKRWNEGKGVYQPVKSYYMDKEPVISFGNISVSSEGQQTIKDITGPSPSIILRKRQGIKPDELHVFEFRPSYRLPRKHIVGRTIMIEEPAFYFSGLSKDFMDLQIYKGDPEKGHPEMLEIRPVTKIGEGPSTPLL